MESAFAFPVRLLALRNERWVRRFRAARGRVEETVTNSRAGSVRSRLRATRSSEVGGGVAELPARKGGRVRRGEVPMRVAPADDRAQVSLQEALAAAQAARAEACRAASRSGREPAARIRHGPGRRFAASAL